MFVPLYGGKQISVGKTYMKSLKDKYSETGYSETVILGSQVLKMLPLYYR